VEIPAAGSSRKKVGKATGWKGGPMAAGTGGGAVFHGDV